LIGNDEIIEGQIKKANIFNRYTRKYFIIKEDHYLYYGKTKATVKPKMYLKECYLDKDDKRGNKFKLVNSKKRLKFKTENLSAKQNLCKVIERIIGEESKEQ
jgi:hypothetical protein